MRRGLILGILLFVIVTAAWWFLFMSGKSSEISDFEDQTAAAKIEASTLEARRTQLEALAAKEGDYLFGLSQIESSIPTLPDEAALIEKINEIMLDPDVELLSLSPSPPAPSPIEGLFEISTSFTFEAPYFKAVSVLVALEELERLVRVEQIAIDAALDDDGANILSVTLTANAFSSSDLPLSVQAEDAADAGDAADSGDAGDGGEE